MSAKERARTCAATNCCANPSRSVPLRPLFPKPSREAQALHRAQLRRSAECALPHEPRSLADGPRPDEPGQQANPGNERVPFLPRAQLKLGSRVAVDLPGEIFRSARERRARLGQPNDGKRLSLDPPPAPAW